MDSEVTNSRKSNIGSTRVYIDAALSAARNYDSVVAKNHLLLVGRHVEDAHILLTSN